MKVKNVVINKHIKEFSVTSICGYTTKALLMKSYFIQGSKTDKVLIILTIFQRENILDY